MSILEKTKRGKNRGPYRILLYGREGIGKSTWAAGAPDPYFLCENAGTDELDVARNDEIRTWEALVSGIDELRTAKHGYKSVVIDTVDWVEPIIYEYVCRKGGKLRPDGTADIEAFGYQKGYVSALDQWRLLASKLEHLQAERKTHVILLGHSQIRTFNNPADTNYDRYELKIHKTAAGFLKEWPNAVLFANYEVFVKTQSDKDKKGKGIGDGTRLIHTVPHPSWDAKNRYSLPDTIPLPATGGWAEFEAAVARGEGAQSAQPEKKEPRGLDEIGKEIDSLLARLDKQSNATAIDAVKRAGGDAAKLELLAEWMRQLVA